MLENRLSLAAFCLSIYCVEESTLTYAHVPFYSVLPENRFLLAAFCFTIYCFKKLTLIHAHALKYRCWLVTSFFAKPWMNTKNTATSRHCRCTNRVHQSTLRRCKRPQKLRNRPYEARWVDQQKIAHIWVIEFRIRHSHVREAISNNYTPHDGTHSTDV